MNKHTHTSLTTRVTDTIIILVRTIQLTYVWGVCVASLSRMAVWQVCVLLAYFACFVLLAVVVDAALLFFCVVVSLLLSLLFLCVLVCVSSLSSLAILLHNIHTCMWFMLYGSSRITHHIIYLEVKQNNSNNERDIKKGGRNTTIYKKTYLGYTGKWNLTTSRSDLIDDVCMSI